MNWNLVWNISLLLAGVGLASLYWMSLSRAFLKGQQDMYLKLGGRPEPPDPEEVWKSVRDISLSKDILFDHNVVAHIAAGTYMYNWKEVFLQIVRGAEQRSRDMDPSVNTLILRAVKVIPSEQGVDVDYVFEPLNNPNANP